MVLGRGVRYGLAGAVVGVGLALAAGRWLVSASLGVQHTPASMIVLVAAVLVGLAAVASWWPGYQAARVSPVEALAAD